MSKRIGRYDIVEAISRGGSGEVLRARDAERGDEVALKVFAPLRDDARARERFRREGEVLETLDHPHLIRVREVGEHEGVPFIALDLAQGGTLSERIHRTGPLPLREAVAGMLEISEALEHAHGEGILHRDLKPENVLIRADGCWCLTDFGLALDTNDMSDRLSVSGFLLGTPSFMAPEQAEGRYRSTDVRTDVYGLGGILYSCLTGEPPHQGTSLHEVMAQVLAPKQLSARDCPDAGLRAICLTCLDPDPDRRYATVADLAWALRDWKPSSRTGALWALGALAAVVTVALTVVVAVRSRAPATDPPTPSPPEVATALPTPSQELSPTEGNAERLQTGHADLSAKRYAAALAAADAVLEKEPRSFPAAELKILALIRLKERVRAREAAQALLGQTERRAEALALDAYVLLQERSTWRDAELRCRDAITLDQTCLRAWLVLSEGLLARGRVAESLAAASRAVEIAPDSVQGHHLRGICSFYVSRAKKGSTAAAFADLRRALELDPRHAASLHMLGFFSFQEGRYDDAERSLSAAIALEPSSDNYFYRAWSRLRLGRGRLAEADLAEAIKLDETRARNFALRAGLRQRRGDISGARLDAAKGLKRSGRPGTEAWVAEACRRIMSSTR